MLRSLLVTPALLGQCSSSSIVVWYVAMRAMFVAVKRIDRAPRRVLVVVVVIRAWVLVA